MSLFEKISAGICGCLLLVSQLALAQTQDSICAVVKIEIKQELTLERQAFDAEMRIDNALEDKTLENVRVDVLFTDEEGDPVIASSDTSAQDAKFFIRVSSLLNIDAVDGTGEVLPASTAVANWLIIPAPGAAIAENGTLYFVGARLSYAVSGETETITVAPDRILVKPLPRLTLDYFLEEDVNADDPFTASIEPSVPFTLGVRVKNNGKATAQNVKIDSAQPKIIENDQGLLIGFEIISSFINDHPAQPTLLAEFSDIPPDDASTGRWQMTASLAGKFTEFTASFTHADELGGELTSIIDDANTHFLIKDVLSDLPGRDLVLDFLADDGDAIRLYESSGVDTEVFDASESASLAFVRSQNGLDQYTLNVQANAGYMYARIEDAFSFEGSKIIEGAIRSDGKTISPNNVWFSQKIKKPTGFDYYLNIFDTDSTGQYTLIVGDRIDFPQAPVLQFIPDRNMKAGESIEFLVEASDPNGTIPVVSVDNAVANFEINLSNTDDNIARYAARFTPESSQVGRVEINFLASDGFLSSSRKAFINVLSNNDSDDDGMDDDWEMENFGTLDRDGTGDYDGDGVSDLDEFLQGSDPRTGPLTGPDSPVIQAPLFASEVLTQQPVLLVANDVNSFTTYQYYFEVFSDNAFTDLVYETNIRQQLGLSSSIQVPLNLKDNTNYYWRVRAFANELFSEWTQGQFRVNTVNDAPSVPVLSMPMADSRVDSFSPILEVSNSTDLDLDILNYIFVVYEDEGGTTTIHESLPQPQGDDGVTRYELPIALTENIEYYWQVKAIDNEGLEAASSILRFTVDTTNDAPSYIDVLSPIDNSEIQSSLVDLLVSESIDPEGDTISYDFEIDTADSFDTENLQQFLSVSSTILTVSDLLENETYFWRARAKDSESTSDWVSASFVVNVVESAPSIPTIQNPGDGAWVSTINPLLSVNPSIDVDGDEIDYRFEIFADREMTQLTETGLSEITQYQVSSALADNRWYYFRVRAEDVHGLVSDYGPISSFFVNDNDFNDPPELSFTGLSEDVVVEAGELTLRWTDSDPDSNAIIDLYAQPTDSSNPDDRLVIARNIEEDLEGENDHIDWDVRGLTDTSYTVIAVIADEESVVEVVAEGLVRVQNTVINVAPIFTFTNLQSTIESDGEVSFLWQDEDPDSDARIVLSYALVLSDASLDAWTTINNNFISENDSVDTYTWITTDIASGEYRIRATITDEENSLDVIATGSVLVDNSVPNVAPQIAIQSLLDSVEVTEGNSFTVAWTDSDPDSNAVVSLYLSLSQTDYQQGVLVADGINEDDAADNIVVSEFVGINYDQPYYLHAVIVDEESTSSAVSQGTFTLTAIAVNSPPSLVLNSIQQPLVVRDSTLLLNWGAYDSDSTALIRWSLVADVQQDLASFELHNESFAENDGEASQSFDLTSVADGSYWVRGVISDEDTVLTLHSVSKITVETPQGNVPPSIRFDDAADDSVYYSSEVVRLNWTDADPDSNASIQLISVSQNEWSDTSESDRLAGNFGKALRARIRENNRRDRTSIHARRFGAGIWLLVGVITDEASASYDTQRIHVIDPYAGMNAQELSPSVLQTSRISVRSRRNNGNRTDTYRFRNISGVDFGPGRIEVKVNVTPKERTRLLNAYKSDQQRGEYVLYKDQASLRPGQRGTYRLIFQGASYWSGRSRRSYTPRFTYNQTFYYRPRRSKSDYLKSLND